MAETDQKQNATVRNTARFRTSERATSLTSTDNSAVSRSPGFEGMITNNTPMEAAVPTELREDIAKDSKFQVMFAKAIDQEASKITSSHKKASALLLSWAKEPDEMDVQKEVDELEEVFKTSFNYTVVKHYLRPEGMQQTSLQVIVTGVIADFLLAHDGPDNLLIVYYAGHGVPGLKNGELLLQARAASPNNEEVERNQIIWNMAEDVLKHANANVFEIFDCCYAGNLGRSRRSSHRYFDYLAATCFDGLARYPGKHSFTAALIWSLKELVSNKESGGRFTTYSLLGKIKDEAPNFPRKQQKPELFPRLDPDHQAGCLMLHPIPKDGDRSIASSEYLSPSDSPRDGRRTCEILTIKFYLKSDMTEDHIKRLAKELHGGLRRIELPVNRIVWGGLHNIAQGAIGTWRARSREGRGLRENPTSADVRPELVQEQRPGYLVKITLAGLSTIAFALMILLLGMMREQFYASRPAIVDVHLV